ncbi:general stress protein CsbD [Babesia caballi]|uniref:General stress protein CsbD n=1 Tax=Babesia caballi TaxID=5871 RepID=A0AAV4LVE5_BABCB|nr:general stress protein CsbD [Babesia caballi]
MYTTPGKAGRNILLNVHGTLEAHTGVAAEALTRVTGRGRNVEEALAERGPGSLEPGAGHAAHPVLRREHVGGVAVGKVLHRRELHVAVHLKADLPRGELENVKDEQLQSVAVGLGRPALAAVDLVVARHNLLRRMIGEALEKPLSDDSAEERAGEHVVTDVPIDRRPLQERLVR